MGCFTGTITTKRLRGTIKSVTHLSGSITSVCPVNVAGPHSLCYDNGVEIWYADGKPLDFE